MAQVSRPEAKIVAVLHDILEDTATTKNELLSLGFDAEVVHAIGALTKNNGENRFQAVQRTVKNPIACEVKLADLSDNMDLSRLESITPKDLIRYKQYQHVQAILLEAQRLHQHVQMLNLATEYPQFHYQTLRFNYQYLLNASFDELHPLGGGNIDSPQEWWILFEDVSHYLSFCKRKKIHPQQAIFLNLINETDHTYLGEIFQKYSDQEIFIKLFYIFKVQYFDWETVC